MLNHIVLMGRLTKDPELRSIGNGTSVASFRLAVDRDFGNRETGEKQTDFIDVVAWRQTAEFVSRYFSKGRMAVVSGRLQMRDWTDRDGNKRTSYEVVAENVYFGDSKNAGRDDDGYSPRGESSRSTYSAPSRSSFESARNQASASSFQEIDEVDGDLPF
ncbi:MAG: single-stranded DNA-binding protein [Oscillospiraceae bacterium]|nr:single-stranded DNA-binding protein [Oscillospiraceae bacterium]